MPCWSSKGPTAPKRAAATGIREQFRAAAWQPLHKVLRPWAARPAPPPTLAALREQGLAFLLGGGEAESPTPLAGGEPGQRPVESLTAPAASRGRHVVVGPVILQPPRGGQRRSRHPPARSVTHLPLVPPSRTAPSPCAWQAPAPKAATVQRPAKRPG